MHDASEPDRAREAAIAAVDEAIASRKSVRAFLPTAVGRTTVEELLRLASRSASGSNIQPWRVRVIAGDVKTRLTQAIFAAVARDGFEPYRREWNYYPVNWREPFLGRRRKIGWDMYSLLGVAKGDFEGTQQARMRNYEFFGAPVGMIFTLDEDLEIGSWLDLGIFLGSVMIAARGHGLHTCPQAAFADFHSIIRPLLNIADNEIIICGMALGHIDPDAPVNNLKYRAGEPRRIRHVRRAVKAMALSFPKSIVVAEVGPRDGLQSFPRWIDTDTKVDIIDRLSDLGLPVIEVSSFAHPKVVPHLRDAEEVFARIKRRPGTVYRALVPNARGAQRAAKARVNEMLGLITISATYTRKNQNMSIDQAYRAEYRIVPDRGSRLHSFRHGARHGILVRL